MLQQDDSGLAIAEVFSRNGLDDILRKYAFKQIKPAEGIDLLVRDSAYNGFKWRIGLRRIIDRYDHEKSFKAADSLGSLIARRKVQWGSCLESP